MPNVSADEVITLKHKRNFIQFGGAKPVNPVKFSGQDAQYLAIEGVSASETGGIDPIFVHDPRRVGKYRLIGRSISAPDLPSATLLMREKHGSIPRQLTSMGCKFNLYEATGNCNDLSDFLAGWSDYVLIYSGALVNDKDLGNRTGWDADDAIEDSLSLTLSEIYPIGSLSFGEGGSTQIDRQIIDIAYGSQISCGDCTPEDDGTRRIYAVTAPSGAGSPGLPAELIYTLDGGTSWNQTTITGMGATETPVALDVAGSTLIIVGDGAYYYAPINQVTGVPGTFAKVSTGFVALHDPLDIYVSSPREIFFSAEGGYIYKCTNLGSGVAVVSDGSATTEDLTRIHGIEETIVAVGTDGATIKTVNRGTTWNSTTTTPVTALTNITAVRVLDKNRFWAGTNYGRLYYTLDGGETWSEMAFSGNGSGQVKDIVFSTDEVGFFSHSTTTPSARLFTTWNGGADWTNTSPRLLTLPTCDYLSRIAVPDADAFTASNNIAMGGLAGDGTDGIIVIGVAGKQ